MKWTGFDHGHPARFQGRIIPLSNKKRINRELFGAYAHREKG